MKQNLSEIHKTREVRHFASHFAQINISFENGVSFIFIHEYSKFLMFQGLG